MSADDYDYDIRQLERGLTDAENEILDLQRDKELLDKQVKDLEQRLDQLSTVLTNTFQAIYKDGPYLRHVGDLQSIVEQLAKIRDKE